MACASRQLYLRFTASQPRVLERLVEFAPGTRMLGPQLVVALGDRHAEEILAECRRLGVRVLGSSVERSGPEVD